MKSVNVFKNDPSNKITISNGGVPCGEFETIQTDTDFGKDDESTEFVIYRICRKSVW